MPSVLSTSPTPTPGRAPNITEAPSDFSPGMSFIDCETAASPTPSLLAWGPYDAFKALFGTICPYDTNHPIFTILVSSGINTINTFLYIAPSVIDSLSPNNPTWKAHRTRLKLLQQWLISLRLADLNILQDSYWQPSHCPHTKQEFDN